MKRILLGILLTAAFCAAILVCALNAQTLQWTEPGDDGDVGRVDHYEIRWAMTPDSLLLYYSDAHIIPNPPIPDSAGHVINWNLEDWFSALPPDTVIYVVAKAFDEAGNYSYSNIASKRTRDTIPPGTFIIRFVP